MFRNYALHHVPVEKRKFFQSKSKPEYSKSYSILDTSSIDSWFGFIFIKNDSDFKLRLEIMPKLKGAKLFYPTDEIDEVSFSVELEPGADSISLIRCHSPGATVGYTSVIKNRGYSDAELIAKAQGLQEHKFFDRDRLTSMKILNELDASVYLFENNSADKTLSVIMDLAMENLSVSQVAFADETQENEF